MLPAEPRARRYWNKAWLIVEGWKTVFKTGPTKHAVIRAMSVAEFESNLGDAGSTGLAAHDRSWKGEHNWGAIQRRGLSASEAATLRAHGISADGGEDAVMRARALLPAAPNEGLHRDSSPGGHWYFAWYWAFDNDRDAAAQFLRVLVQNRPNVRAIIDHCTPYELARAMYQTKYYEGFHKDDPEQNVKDYEKKIAGTGAQIEAALAGWDPAEPLHDPLPPATPRPSPTAASSGSGSSGPVILGLVVLGFAVSVSLLQARSRRR